jgi:hypothetical protein
LLQIQESSPLDLFTTYLKSNGGGGEGSRSKGEILT